MVGCLDIEALVGSHDNSDDKVVGSGQNTWSCSNKQISKL